MALKWLLGSTLISQVFGHSLAYPNEVKDRKEAVMNVKIICKDEYPNGFQMPLHYPRYTKGEYEKMEEWKVDLLLKEYGLSFKGNTLEEKRVFAMGAFLWPDQL